MAVATGTALLASAALGAGATLYGASKASKASDVGTAAATAASKNAIDTEWAMYSQSRKDYAPWRKTGEWGLNKLKAAIKAGPGEFVPEEQPGYEFGFKNFIEKPYLGSQSAKGKRLSGETNKGLIGYAQDYATTAYDNFLQRYYQKFNPLQSLAGVGMNAAGGQANAAIQTGGAISGLQQGIGNIQAQNALNQGNIQTGMAAGIAGVGQQAGQNYMNYMIGKKMGVM